MKVRFAGRVCSRIISATAFFAVLAIGAPPANAELPVKPAVLSFTVSPASVDLSSANAKVVIDLLVTAPHGISSPQTLATISDGGAYTLVAPLVRTDFPINNALQSVKFEGRVDVASLPAGAYWITAAPVTSLNEDGSAGLATETLSAKSTSTVEGAENALLIRSNGDLNFDYPTFIGPAFNKTLGLQYINQKFNVVADPLWKVGETFSPSDYYESQVSSLALKIKTSTPNVCKSDGSKLTLIATGGCAFTVYTDKTKDYKYFAIDQTVMVTASRIKPAYVISSIPPQSSANLPLSIQGPYVMGPVGLVTPTTATPGVCYGSGIYITIISGGTCTLNYASPGNADYLPSDVYTLSFPIARAPQTVTFVVPNNVSLSNKTLALNATASSGLSVTFQTSTPSICSVTGNSLNLIAAGMCHIAAIQVGTTTIAPVNTEQNIAVSADHTTSLSPKVGKKLICIKNGMAKSVTSKACPKGFQLKK